MLYMGVYALSALPVFLLITGPFFDLELIAGHGMKFDA